MLVSPRTPGLARHANRLAAERTRTRSRRLVIALVAVLAVGGASVAVAMLTSSRGPAGDATSAQGADRTASAPPADPNALNTPADPNAPGAVPPAGPPGAGAPAAPPAGASPPAGATATGAPGESAPPKDAAPTVPKGPKPAAKPGSSTAAKATPSTSAKAGESSAKTGESSAAAPNGAGAAKPAGRQIPIELTGYSFHDNTPAGSAEVSNPVLHKTAGGRGSYADPITVAVPSDSKFDPGTRFYLPSVRRYAIVEDSGASSTSGNHLDLWVDGEGGSESAVESCMDQLTGESTAEVDPPPGRPVIPGPIFAGSCHLPKG